MLLAHNEIKNIPERNVRGCFLFYGKLRDEKAGEKAMKELFRGGVASTWCAQGYIVNPSTLSNS